MDHNQIESQNILTTFFEDIREFIKEQVKNVNLNQKSINFINTEKFETLLIQFIYFRKRYPIGKYRVHIPPSMYTSAKYAKYKNHVLNIKKLLETGKDIGDYLHNDIRDFLFHDNLLKDWGIIHIHLQVKGKRKGEDNDILYAIQIEDCILFLKIDTHDCFLQKELLEILYQNYPNFFGFGPIAGNHFTDTEIKSLRTKNIGYAMALGQKSFFGGLSSVLQLSGSVQILENLRNLSTLICSNFQQIKSEIEQTGYRGNIDLHLIISAREKKIKLLEANSRTEIRFSDNKTLEKLTNCFLNLHLF